MISYKFYIGGKLSAGKNADVVPQSWFTCDVKLGSLSIHLDEDNWLKGNVLDNETNIERMISERQSTSSLANNNSSSQRPQTASVSTAHTQLEASLDFEQRRQKNIEQTKARQGSQGEGMQKAINLGFNLVDKLIREVQTKFTHLEEKRIEKLLGMTYPYYLKLKKRVIEVEENKKVDNGEVADSNADSQQSKLKLFSYLMEAESQKPIWTSYVDSPQDVEKLAHYLPSSMRKHIQFSIPNLDTSNKISLGVNTVHILDLPKFQDGKRLTCNPTTPIYDIIQFLTEKLDFQKQFLMPANEFDPLKYVEVVMKVKYPRPKIPAHQMTQEQLDSLDKPYDELIPLDNNLTLIVVYKLLYPYSGTSPVQQSGFQSRVGSYSMDLLYRKKPLVPVSTFHSTGKLQGSGSKPQAKGDHEDDVTSPDNSTTAQQKVNGSNKQHEQNTDQMETFRSLATPQKSKALK